MKNYIIHFTLKNRLTLHKKYDRLFRERKIIMGSKKIPNILTSTALDDIVNNEMFDLCKHCGSQTRIERTDDLCAICGKEQDDYRIT